MTQKSRDQQAEEYSLKMRNYPPNHVVLHNMLDVRDSIIDFKAGWDAAMKSIQGGYPIPESLNNRLEITPGSNLYNGGIELEMLRKGIKE